jgi:hypothetical protein
MQSAAMVKCSLVMLVLHNAHTGTNNLIHESDTILFLYPACDRHALTALPLLSQQSGRSVVIFIGSVGGASQSVLFFPGELSFEHIINVEYVQPMLNVNPLCKHSHCQKLRYRYHGHRAFRSMVQQRAQNI